VRKKCFTLIEIMIAMAIISLVGTVVGWQIHRMIASHRLESDAEQLCIALQEAQLLAITHETDFQIRLYSDRGKIFYQIKTHEPLAVVDQRPKAFSAVHSLSWKGSTVSSIDLDLYSSGRIEPPESIGLISKDPKKNRSLWVDLQTPLHIKLTSKRPPKNSLKLPVLPKERGT
jgi:prepilin-type N-terminal cleavage/methylation domain-containing protein